MSSPQHNPNPFKELLPSPWVTALMLIFLGLLFWRLFTYSPEPTPASEEATQEQLDPS